MARDIRCLCKHCQEDYIEAGYRVALLYPLMRGLCDKCERPAYSVTITNEPRKRRRKRKKKLGGNANG